MSRLVSLFNNMLMMLVLCLSLNGAAFAIAIDLPASPSPFRYVSDYSQILSSAQQDRLETKLVNYAGETSSQIAVVIMPTIGDHDIAEYSFALVDKWGIGRKGLNNGVLMLIALHDRNIFIAPGQGLEGALPDAMLSQLIREEITPHFKQGNYYQGISSGIDSIIMASQGEYAPQAQDDSVFVGVLPLVFVVIFLVFVWMGRVNSRYVTPTNNHSIGNEPIRRRSHSYDHHNSGFGGGGFGGGRSSGGGAGGSW